MKKIRLDLDTLSIESFDTTATREERGTVQGRATTDMPYCSLGNTCVGSCDTDCNDTYCGTCNVTDCGTCNATECGTCVEASCGDSYCRSCNPHCCDTGSCY